MSAKLHNNKENELNEITQRPQLGLPVATFTGFKDGITPTIEFIGASLPVGTKLYAEAEKAVLSRAPEIAAHPNADKQAQPLIGKLLDEVLQLPVLWGLNQPGALVRMSDVTNVLIVASKSEGAQPVTADQQAAGSVEAERARYEAAFPNGPDMLKMRMDPAQAGFDIWTAALDSRAQPVAASGKPERQLFNELFNDNDDAAYSLAGRSPKTAAWLAWQVSAVIPRHAQPVAQPVAAGELPKLTTDEAREYLVEFMEQHFTDKTFRSYIRGKHTGGGLAGDFAWQMATALRAQQCAGSSLPTDDDDVERFTLYHDHGRSGMMGDDEGKYVLYSQHIEALQKARAGSRLPAGGVTDLSDEQLKADFRAWAKRHYEPKLGDNWQIVTFNVNGGHYALEAYKAGRREAAATLAASAALPAPELTPLDYRAQGREEALAAILSLEPETGLDAYTSSCAIADTGDYSAHWNEDALRELLHIGDRKHDAYDRAEGQYWEALGKTDEAERMMRMVERAPYYKPLHDVLAKHQEWSLLHDLQASAALPGAELHTKLEALLNHVIDDFREMNPSNYTHDEACDLNNWGVEGAGIAQEVRDLLLASPVRGSCEPPVAVGVPDTTELVTLNGHQLVELLEAAWPDRDDADQGDTEITLYRRNVAAVSREGEPLEPGLYFIWAEYPEEGCVALAASPTTDQKGGNHG